VWASAGAADDGKFFQAEVVGDGQDVGGGVGDAAAFQAVRFAVAGTVKGDEPDAQAMQDRGTRVWRLPGVPCRRKTGLPSGSPYTWVESCLPSGAVTG
jgi:hypothetical protein